MNIHWRKEIPTLLVLTVWLVAMLAAWPAAPDRLPTHMNALGQVDGHGGKFMGLLFVPLVAVAMYALMLVVPLRDASFQTGPNRVARLPEFRLVITLVLLLAQLVVMIGGLFPEVGLAAFLPALVGSFFILAGNYLGKTRPNRLFGVRTPWTFRSKLAWVGANRLAGWGMVLEGLLLVVLAMTRPQVWFPVFNVASALLVIGVVLYSYVLFKRDADPMPPFPQG